MVTKMTFTQAEVAVRVAGAIDRAGYEVAVITERADDQESYLVATPEPADRIVPLLPAGTLFVEEPVVPADVLAGQSSGDELPGQGGGSSADR